MADLIPREESELQRRSAALRPLLRRLVGDASADDVLQDTWLAALERPPADCRNPWGWLRAVSRNLAWKRRRAEGRRQRREGEVARGREADTASGGRDVLALHRRLLDAVYALDAPLREVVVGRFLEDTSSRALARRLGVSRATVDRRLEAALVALRVQLAPPDRDGRRRAPAIVLGGAWRSQAPGPATAGALVGGGVMGAKSVVAVVAVVALGWGAFHFLVDRAEPRAEPARSRPDLSAATPTPELMGRPQGRTPVSEAGTAPTESSRPDPEAWLRRIEAAADPDEVRRILLELGRLPPKDTLAVLRAIYDRIGEPAVRRQVLDHFAHQGRGNVHPYATSILDLGVRDPDDAVAKFALAASAGYALRPLALADGTYQAWRDEMLDKTLAEVLVIAGRPAARRLVGLEGEAFRQAVREVGFLNAWFGRVFHGVDLEAVAREEGAWDWAHRLWSHSARDLDTRLVALRFLAEFGVTEAFVTRELLPFLTRRSQAPALVVAAVVRYVGEHHAASNLQALLKAFALYPPSADGEAHVWAALTLAVRAHVAAMPTLIAALAHEPLEERTKNGIGQALAALAEITHDPATLDAAWWRTWWLENRGRFPADVATLDVPASIVPRR